MVRPRNDAALSTGLSSAVERRRAAAQQELHDKKQRQQEATKVSLTRDGSAINDWIDEEIAKVSDLRQAITEFDLEAFMKKVPLAKRLNVTHAELLQAQTIARLMHIEWLEKAKSRVKKHMKEPKTKPAKDGESFDE